MANALPHFEYIDGTLHFDGINTHTLKEIYGTPLYAYSQRTLLENYQSYTDAFDAIDHQICYAVKANSNLAILKTLAKAGAGFDIVSKGELARVLQVPMPKGRVFWCW